MVKNRKKYDYNRKINGNFWIIIAFFTVVYIKLQRYCVPSFKKGKHAFE